MRRVGVESPKGFARQWRNDPIGARTVSVGPSRTSPGTFRLPARWRYPAWTKYARRMENRGHPARCAWAESNRETSHVPQPDHISIFDLPDPESLDEDMRAYFAICEEKLGMVPNVLRTFSANQDKLRAFSQYYNTLMLAPSKLSKLEREMVAVVVSSANRCFYCLVAHGAAVRRLSGDPELGEMLVMNYRVAPLEPRQRAILDFAWKLTTTPWEVEEPDRAGLRDAGLTDEEIFDLADVVGFFNMSNRFAIATDMMPNREYHGMDRG